MVIASNTSPIIPETARINPSIDRLAISGRLLRIARLRSETYDPLEDPQLYIKQARERGIKADLFSFAQRYSESELLYGYYYEMEQVAILEIDSYEKWWKQTINDKTRNMVRKAEKKEVLIKIVGYGEELVQGIKQIYDEYPIRQGKRSRHYGKNIEAIKRDHSTFLESSEFIAATHENRLIGFAKVVFRRDFASIMNLIALIAERDKAPTNALLAKVVERCSAKGIHILHYGVWSRRGFGDFKIHNGFQCRQIPRYYVPLTAKGSLALKLGLHRPPTDRIPEDLLDFLATVRMKWYAFRYPPR